MTVEAMETALDCALVILGLWYVYGVIKVNILFRKGGDHEEHEG